MGNLARTLRLGAAAAALVAALALPAHAAASRPTVVQLRLDGVVGSEEEREAVVTVARGVRGVVAVDSDVKIFRRPVR